MEVKTKVPSEIKEAKEYILDLDTSLVLEGFPVLPFVSNSKYAFLIFKDLFAIRLIKVN